MKFLNRLNARFVESVKTPGRYADGGGLYLVVRPRSKAWVYRYRPNGKMTDRGLGGYPSVSLALARAKVETIRAALARGDDPFKIAEFKKTKTFIEVADELIKAMEPNWRNEKHRQQWRMTIDVYAEPLHNKAIDEIETNDVLDVLKPIWTAKAETASRLRGRMEAILAKATALGLRSGPNPAQWRNNLQHVLPKRLRLTRGHHHALPYAQVPALIAQLRASRSVSSLALEFLILTAGRTGEVIGATWSEIDFDEHIWTVPASRMKAGREHRVPLSTRALDIIKEMKELRADNVEGSSIFPGRASKQLSNMALDAVLRRLGIKDQGVTVHGFRSAFRDWVGEETNFPSDIAEMALAHLVGDRTERAYRRKDALSKRRELMTAWGQYCESAV